MASEILEKLQDFSWVVEPHLLLFFVDDIWETWPKEWAEILNSPTRAFLKMAADGTLDPSWPEIFKNMIQTAFNLSIPRANQLYEFVSSYPRTITRHHSSSKISSKKSMEVSNLSAVIVDVVLKNKLNVIVECGSGQGYLTQHLAESLISQFHPIKIYAVDYDKHQTTGSQSRILKAFNLKSQTPDTDYIEITPDHSIHFKTQFISSESLDILIQEIVSESTHNSISILLTGLHTCGNLSSVILTSFAKWKGKGVDAVVNCGCCYHLLTERENTPTYLPKSLPQTETNFYDHTANQNGAIGFPLSKFYQDQMSELEYAQLGEHARVVACQSPFRLSVDLQPYVSESSVDGIPPQLLGHYYRALLQFLFSELDLVKVFPHICTDAGIIRVKRLPKSAYNDENVNENGFVVYATAALKKLLNSGELSVAASALVEWLNNRTDGNVNEGERDLDPLLRKFEQLVCLDYIRKHQLLNPDERETSTSIFKVKKMMVTWYLTRSVIAMLVENVILFDRVLYLRELDGETGHIDNDQMRRFTGNTIDVHLLPIFDVDESPRNLIVVGINKI
ncbi:hypothetical protein HK098_000455 [Nowakowskiella sp. JEL0407]|nr:hypothetical protein HK098_000455 [Nowakowskiella sp. JEL0407]